jgi:hypothetical protein
MTTTLSISQLITDAIESLPEKVRYKCDRAKIDKWLERYGCTCDAELLLAALNREDSRAALKMHAPPILMAKLLVWLSPKVVGGDGNELPPGFELLLHEPLPEDTLAHAGMRQSTRVVTFPFATPSQGQRRLRPPKLIRGAPPARADLDLMCPLYSCERALYPAAFLDKIGLCTVFFCEQLSYDGQRRRDVPDLDGGTLFIDVSDRAVRRSRHAWHHELWHMADFQLRGPAFEQPDAEWEAHNPDSFTYGFGGQFMRTPGTADPPSAPSEHFINAYATSSIAEDKAEVWAALLCYEHVLRTRSLRAKANLLKQRAAALCPEIGASFWEIVRWHQRALGKEWEPCWYGQMLFWRSWASNLTQLVRPPSEADDADLLAVLRLAGLESHGTSFTRQGCNDLAFLHSSNTEEQRAILGTTIGLTMEEATRLLTVLDGFLLPPQPATTNKFDQTATPHTHVRDVGVGPA